MKEVNALRGRDSQKQEENAESVEKVGPPSYKTGKRQVQDTY
jgi:hypothetical protein